MSNDSASAIQLPANAAVKLRRHLGLSESAPLRITFLPGPGDVAGTFDYWRAGQHDPRVPTIAYSWMFYELMEQLGAECQISTLHPISAATQATSSAFHFEQIAQRPATGRWGYFRSQRAYARDVISMTNRFDPHVVITSTHNPSATWPALTRGRKLVLSAHNTFWPMGHPPRSLLGRLRKARLTSQAAALDGAICTSHECARQIATLTGGRILGEVEYPQIVARHPIETRHGVRKLLFLGRLERSKGIFLLLEAFERLATQHPDLELLIAGSGRSEKEFTAAIAASPQADRIVFLGRIGSEAVHRCIAESDLLVCPTMTSFNEGLAVVGFEAAAHGLPTLLSSVVPAADLLGESCTICAADDAEALAGALRALIESPQVYRDRCAATAVVRAQMYDRSQSWGSGLYRALMAA